MNKEKDLNDLKKWFKNLGLEIDGKIKDDDIKKLMSPQLRDIWRNMVKHVRPKEEVKLIKKVNLLHKLQKHQKPLMARVDCDTDFDNVLKYEELSTTYNKIENDVNSTKIINNQLKNDLIERYRYKTNLINDIKMIENKCYIAKNKIECYNKYIAMLDETPTLCDHFSTIVNETLTKTDYEDSLIKCLIEIDNTKQSDKLYNSINVGSNLFNNIYTIINDKSSTVLLQNIEEILKSRINMSNNFIETTKSSPNLNDDKEIDNELFTKLFEIQSNKKSQLLNIFTEKQSVIEKLKYNTNFVISEIVNQHKLKNITCTDHELKEFEIDLKLALKLLFEKSISCSNSMPINDSFKLVNEVIEQIKILNQEIDQKIIKISAADIFSSDNNCKFNLMKILNTDLIKLENYLKETYSAFNMTPCIISIKNIFSKDVENIYNFPIKVIPELRLQKLQNIKPHFQIINFIKEIITKFEQFNNIFFTKTNDYDEISQKVAIHIKDFDIIATAIENNILELDLIIKDTQLITNIMLKM